MSERAIFFQALDLDDPAEGGQIRYAALPETVGPCRPRDSLVRT
jgi:hypothetical protein